MAHLKVFQSGNPAWATCKKAMDVAEKVKEKYGDKLDLNIFTSDSEEARKYNFKSATNVLLDEETVPLDVATDQSKMEQYLEQKIWDQYSREGTNIPDTLLVPAL